MEQLLERLGKKFESFFAERPLVNGELIIDKDDIHGKIVVWSLLNLNMVKKIDFQKIDDDAEEPISPVASNGYALKVYF